MADNSSLSETLRKILPQRCNTPDCTKIKRVGNVHPTPEELV